MYIAFCRKYSTGTQDARLIVYSYRWKEGM